jgi:hypothetical protein
MRKFRKELRIQSKIAMSFIGRVFARLRHLQRLAKERIDAIQLAITGNKIVIYHDSQIVLEATKADQYSQEWKVGLTDKYTRLLVA